jgi:predicted RNA-binding protein associated with RNAse of E/G family
MLAYLVRMFEVDFIPQLEFENLDDLTTSGLTVMVQKSGMPAGAVTDLPSEQRLFVALLLKIAALCNQEPPLVDLDSLAASGNSGSLNYRRLLGIFAEQRQVICFSRSGSNKPKNLTIGRHGAWQE